MQPQSPPSTVSSSTLQYFNCNQTKAEICQWQRVCSSSAKRLCSQFALMSSLEWFSRASLPSCVNWSMTALYRWGLSWSRLHRAREHFLLTHHSHRPLLRPSRLSRSGSTYTWISLRDGRAESTSAMIESERVQLTARPSPAHWSSACLSMEWWMLSSAWLVWRS